MKTALILVAGGLFALAGVISLLWWWLGRVV